jgi:hypothetical protein
MTLPGKGCVLSHCFHGDIWCHSIDKRGGQLDQFWELHFRRQQSTRDLKVPDMLPCASRASDVYEPHVAHEPHCGHP